MTTKEILQEYERLKKELSGFSPKVLKHIKETVQHLFERSDTDMLDFSEWGICTGSNDSSCITVYGKHGPNGDGPVIGFKKEMRGTRETILLTIGTEYGWCYEPLDALGLPELLDIIGVLDSLEVDLNSDNPEWEIDENGEIVPID